MEHVLQYRETIWSRDYIKSVRTYQISVSSVEERDYKLGEMQSILLPLPYCL